MTKWLAAAALALARAFTAPAQAASFDCAKASSPDEVAICADPGLSALDSEMGGLWYAYSRVPMLMGSSGNRRDAAQGFLADRRRCGSDTPCLKGVYTARIEVLRRGIDAAMAELGRMQTGV